MVYHVQIVRDLQCISTHNILNKKKKKKKKNDSSPYKQVGDEIMSSRPIGCMCNLPTKKVNDEEKVIKESDG